MADTLLAAALRGHSAGAPPRTEWPAFLASAGEQGILPLLSDAAVKARWDADIIAAMRPSVAAETALAILRERELRRVLTALADFKVVPLLLKGAHLAFTLYPSPDRRPRVDTDLLIKEMDRAPVRRCLTTLGYDMVPNVTGEVAFGQFQFWRVDDSGARHTIDVHWRIANPKVFADRLTYDELMSAAAALPRLGPNAFVPSPGHALLIACLHRTAHHGTSTRLVWLYDIHLLASSLSPSGWDNVAEMATGRGLASVVAAGVEDAIASLATHVPQPILDRLRANGETETDVRVFLDGAPPKLRVALSDWQRVRGWRGRWRFLSEHLFPSAAFIRRRYGVSSSAALPFLYAHRIVTGSIKWLAGK
jgi:hypothetical protein